LRTPLLTTSDGGFGVGTGSQQHKDFSLRHQAQESPYNTDTAKIVKINRYRERLDHET